MLSPVPGTEPQPLQRTSALLGRDSPSLPHWCFHPEMTEGTLTEARTASWVMIPITRSAKHSQYPYLFPFLMQKKWAALGCPCHIHRLRVKAHFLPLPVRTWK